MTWEQLQHFIENLTDEQKQTDVTVRCSESDEFLPATNMLVNQDHDQIDLLHPFIEF